MAAERVYTVEFEGVAVTAVQDFFSILPATQKPCRLLGLLLSQSSDVGDAAEEILRYRIIRGHTTVGSGGTAPTPRPVVPSDGAAGFTARANDTTIASAGTAVNLLSDGFNIRTGLPIFLPPECQIVCANAEFLVVRLVAAPADSLTMSGTLWIAELA